MELILTSFQPRQHSEQVDTSEFINGLATLGKCCGSACPLYSFCATLRYEAGLVTDRVPVLATFDAVLLKK